MTCLLFWMALAAAELQTPAPYAVNEELRGYLCQAAERHPGLRARHQTWQAALERVPQVKSLDDPMFSVGQALTADALSPRITLQQAFPWFGTLRARGDKAAAEAEAALQAFYAERDRVFLEVKRAYYETAFLAEQLRVMKSQIEIFKYMEDVVRSKLALGLAMDDELLRVSMRLAEMEDRLKQMQGMKPVLDAQLNAAMGVDAAVERPWPASMDAAPEAPPLDTVLAGAQSANPELRQYDSLRQSFEEQARIARKQGRPNFTLMLEYSVVPSPPDTDDTDASDVFTALNPIASMKTLKADNGMGGADDGGGDTATSAADSMGGGATVLEPGRTAMSGEDDDDEVMLTLGLSLPIWRKRVRAGIEEAHLLAEAAGSERQRLGLGLRAQAQQAIFELQDAHRRHALYQDTLLPQSLRTLDSVQQSYATGASNAGLLDVLDAMESMLNYDLEQARASRDAHLAVAELERITGGAWPQGAAPGAAPQAQEAVELPVPRR